MLKIYSSSKCVTYKQTKSKELMLHDIDVLYKNIRNIDEDSIGKIKFYYSMRYHDTITLNSESANYQESRAKFIMEHTHLDCEMRLFTHGTAKFYLHPSSDVYELTVSEGDLISIPANMRHWFDAGEEPDFKAVRFFRFHDGWVPEYTGNDISIIYKNKLT